HRALFETMSNFRREFDVAQQLDALAVLGLGGQVAQLGKRGPNRLLMGCLGVVFRQLRRIGIDDDDAVQAVDDQYVAGRYLSGYVLQTDHGRHAETRRDDGSMRGCTAKVGHETEEILAAL